MIQSISLIKEKNMKFFEILFMITISFLVSNGHSISESCSARDDNWTLSKCIEIYYTEESCYLPIDCDIDMYPCAGFCDQSTAVIEFPCQIKYE